MRFCQRRRNHYSLFGIASRVWKRCRALAGKVANNSPNFGTLRVSQSVIRIQLDRLIKVIDSFAVVFSVTPHGVEMPLKISVVRLHAVGSHLSRLFFRAEQGNPE